MAHYDCDNCGNPGGIDYGVCQFCTPNWVTQARNILAYNKGNIRNQVEEKYKPLIEEEIKNRIASELAEEQEEFDLIFEAGKDWYKLKSEMP
jgi:hypothetical protein